MLVSDIDRVTIQAVSTRWASIPVSLASNNRAINETVEFIKNSTVPTNNLSISFLCVPKSNSILTILEFEKAGIIENAEKNKAVANAENEKDAVIISI